MMLKNAVKKFIAGFGIFILGTSSASYSATELLPNLKPLPAYDLGVFESESTGETHLLFSTLTWNSGLGPMEIFGGESPGQNLKNVYQRIYLDDGTTYDKLAGSFEHHEEHGHIHFEDYADYILQPVNAPGASERKGQKTSFCLLDTTKIDNSLPDSPTAPVYVECEATTQGISVGWGDAYPFYLPGQSIDITGLPSGEYYLSLVADPKNRLLETNDSDNESKILIYLDMENLTATVVDNSPGDPTGEEIVESIEPNVVDRGSTVPIVVKGSGFDADADIQFVNGKGPAPILSNVNVVDENTIEAVVSTKKGGGRKSIVWDLQVGTGLLPNALTIRP